MTFYIGTCRYMDYDLWDNFFPARLHSTKEIIYFLENINNIKQILTLYSNNISNIIFGDIFHKSVYPLLQNFYQINDLNAFDNINIEITSRKVLYNNNIPVNFHYGNYYLQQWKNNIFKSNNKNIKQLLSDISFVENCKYHELSDEEIKKDIIYINNLVKTIFDSKASFNIITQINLKLIKTNNYIAERDNLVQCLKDISADINIICYDVGKYIEKNYDEKYMENYVKDNQHFNSILKYNEAIKVFTHTRPASVTKKHRIALNSYNLV